MWSSVPLWFLARLLAHHHCLDQNDAILWTKVFQHPTVFQHIVLHILTCCQKASHVPKNIWTPENHLQSLGAALALSWGVPLTDALAKDHPTLVVSSHESIKEEISLKPKDLGIVLQMPKR